MKINLSSLQLHDWECESKKGKRKFIPYGKLLSELFYKNKLIKNLKDYGASSELDTEYGKVFNYVTSVNMKILKSDEVLDSKLPFSIRQRNPDFINNDRVILRLDNKEVIQSYTEEGVNISMEDIPDGPLDMYKAPKKKKSRLWLSEGA